MFHNITTRDEHRIEKVLGNVYFIYRYMYLSIKQDMALQKKNRQISRTPVPL